MSNTKKRDAFIESEEGVKAKQMLETMEADMAYNTQPTYCANGELYPDHSKPFVDQHMDYLCAHQDISPMQYISNLRLMSRIR